MKILFVNYNASRTGAPLLLLSLIKEMRLKHHVTCETLFLHDGPLLDQFQALGPCTVIPHKKNITAPRIIRFFHHIFQVLLTHWKIRKIRHDISNSHFDSIHFNTAVVGEIFKVLPDTLPPIICHIHELKWVIDNHSGGKHFEKIKNKAAHFIATSKMVQNQLLTIHNIDAAKMSLHYGFICVESTNKKSKEKTIAQIKSELNIPQHAKVICGGGTVEWRKGTDLFIKTAQHIINPSLSEPIHFVWIGGDPTRDYQKNLLHEIDQAGLSKHIHFITKTTNPYPYLALGDIFILTSREDPFPLMCLESASLKKPLICFKDTSGSEELIERGCGFVVPHLDTKALANKILELLNNPQLQKDFGEQGHQIVQSELDVSIATQIVLQIHQRIIEESTN